MAFACISTATACPSAGTRDHFWWCFRAPIPERRCACVVGEDGGDMRVGSYSGLVTEEPFDACWQRLDRADSHRREAIEIWNEYTSTHPCNYSLDHEGSGEHVLRVWPDEPMPAQLAVVIGEWFYSLRCALDYIVWATAVTRVALSRRPVKGFASIRSTTRRKPGTRISTA